ncbi:hypothetical protein [Paenibacillus sp. RC67]|uniref:hypothetical protein n=1 Tax=Paenibacillus sp. RC67 TaxID=3039392 RepID=UPI0024ADCCD5|nr:hypothetical protein [Paenibacillus sp. RC67]
MKPSEHELKLLGDYILLPIAITVVNTNRIEMETSTATLRKLYSDTAMIMMNRMREELSVVRQKLDERRIVVIDTEEFHEGEYVHYPYVLRGHHGMFAINKEVIRTSVIAHIHRYVAEVVHIVALNQANPTSVLT